MSTRSWGRVGEVGNASVGERHSTVQACSIVCSEQRRRGEMLIGVVLSLKPSQKLAELG